MLGPFVYKSFLNIDVVIIIKHGSGLFITIQDNGDKEVQQDQSHENDKTEEVSKGIARSAAPHSYMTRIMVVIISRLVDAVIKHSLAS
jgi:hypothetical protein